MSNVAILGTPHRSYDESRDWLVTDEMPRRQSAQVVQFTSRLERCSICQQTGHRASRCKQRPGQQAD